MLKRAINSNLSKEARHLRIGEVASESGLSVETLRFYERRGLLGRPHRTAANYRVYQESVLERLDFIKRAQTVGFSLDEIQEIIKESENGRLPCQHVRELARAKLAELDARLTELRRHRTDLARLLDEWDERGEREGNFCGLIEHSSLKKSVEAGAHLQRSARKGKRR